MNREQYFREAEKAAAKAAELLGEGDGQASAAVWAAVAQVYATLALAAAERGASGRGRPGPLPVAPAMPAPATPGPLLPGAPLPITADRLPPNRAGAPGRLPAPGRRDSIPLPGGQHAPTIPPGR
jgi:hypothetical protein